MHAKSMFQSFQDFEFATYKNWKGIFIFQIFESQNWTVFNKIWKYIIKLRHRLQTVTLHLEPKLQLIFYLMNTRTTDTQ